MFKVRSNFVLLKKFLSSVVFFLLSIYVSYKETATHDLQSHTFHSRRGLVSTWKSLQGWHVVLSFVKPLHLSLLSDNMSDGRHCQKEGFGEKTQ